MMPEKLQPKTRKVDVVEDFHGVKVSDPYRWLEEDSGETQEWIEGQNKFTRSVLDKIAARTELKSRLNEVFRIGTVGVPTSRGCKYFFEERKGTDDLSILYVQEGLNGSSRVLIDPNTLSEDKKTVLHGWHPSPDGKLLAYGLSEAANDQAAIYVLNVDTGENLPGHSSGSISLWLRPRHTSRVGSRWEGILVCSQT